MRNILVVVIITFFFIGCSEVDKKSSEKVENEIKGTWKLVYGEIKEGDSVQIKELSNTEFIKIINDSHFAFFNQRKDSEEDYYGGAGTYKLVGSNYTEKLEFIGAKTIRGHEFSFQIEFKGDTLIQHGLEEVEAANIKRYIVEKYIRLDE